jgi:hypothetical protein
MTSLLNTADNAPTAAISAASSAGGEMRASASASVTRV